MTRWKAPRLLVFAFTIMLGPACGGDTPLDPAAHPTTGGIVGRVMAGASPRPGVVITVREQARLTVVATRITDSSGSYAVDGLTPGAHRISIHTNDALRCAPADQSAVVVAGSAIEVSFSCVGASLWMSAVGQVFVNFTGEAGIIVRLIDQDGFVIARAITDADGRYALGGTAVSIGAVNVSIQPPIGTTCSSNQWPEVVPRSRRTVNFFCSRPNERPVRSVVLSPDSLTVGVYEVARLTVVVRDTSGVVLANPQIEFLVSGLAEGTVDPAGFVRGLPGQCGDGTVVARSGDVESSPIALHIGSPTGFGCWDY